MSEKDRNKAGLHKKISSIFSGVVIPQSKDLFHGTLKDIGQARFRIIRDEQGTVRQIRRHIGFSTVLLEKVR